MEYGLIGKTLGHSFSKIIHEMLNDNVYELNAIPEEEVDKLLKTKNLKAINVTIPYKAFVIPYLDEVSEDVKVIGACNCIVNRDNKLYGYNTDYSGLKTLIIRHNINVNGKKCYILGSGGTRSTATKVLLDLGAASVLAVSIDNTPNTITYDELNARHDAEIIVNCTPVGMYPNNHKKLINVTDFPNLEGVVDVVYNPLNTALVVDAKEHGIKACGGLEMLIIQAIVASEIFLDVKYPKEEFDRIYAYLYKQAENIVLIGLPMSGKSTIGEALSKALNKELIDIDEEIVKYANKSIPEIFAEVGEPGFRKIETEVISEISKRTNVIISTGGGAILNKVNIDYLKENGFIVYLSRDIDKMIYSDNRPLTKSKEDLLRLKEAREPLYQKYKDVEVDNSTTVEECVNKIKEAFDESFNY